MYTFLAILAVAMSGAFPIVSATLTKPKTAKIIAIAQGAVTAAGAVGLVSTLIAARIYAAGISDAGKRSWALDGISSFYTVSVIVVGVFLLVSMAAALTDHKMYYPRVILCPVGVLSLVLIAPLFTVSAVSGDVNITPFIEAAALFESLLLSARGAIDDHRLYEGLKAEADAKRKVRKKKR